MSNVHVLGTEQDQNTAVVMRVRALQESKAISGAQLAREIGVSTATISQILNDRYTADPSTVIEKLASWLELRNQKQQRPANPGFVMTQPPNRSWMT